MRALRKLLAFLALLLVAVVAVTFLLWRAGPLRHRLRRALATELSRQTNRRVSIGDISISLTGRVVLHRLGMQNQDGSPLLTAPQAWARLGRPTALLSPSTAAKAVTGIALRRPEVTITRDTQKRWSIDDLISRKPKERRFTGDVVVEDGRVKIVDQARGGLTTELANVNLKLRQPAPGETIFSLRAQGTEGAFDTLEGKGRTGGKRGLEASCSVSDLDLAYAFARLPEVSALTVSAGRADITGEVANRPASEVFGAGYTINAEVREAEVSFPWLQRPVTGIEGKVRFADGELHLEEMQGTLIGAPVKASGVLSDLKHPRLAVDYTATGLRFEQLKHLLPKLYLPMTLALPSPLRIIGRVEGPFDNVEVTGRAEVRVLKFHLVPWHDVAATFNYSKGQLRIRGLRAHGSPRALEADIDITWPQGRAPKASASFSLVDVPVATLAQMVGLERVDLQGTASFKGSASLDRGASVTGEFIIRNAARGGLSLGTITGELEYSDRAALIRRARIVGPVAKGEFSARIPAADDYELQANLASLEAAALGQALGQPRLTGRFPASIRASGSFREARASGRISLGPGQMQGRAFESATASFALSTARARLSDVSVRLPRGSYQGAVEITGWAGRGQQAALTGHFSFSGVHPADWLPPPYGVFVTAGTVDGTAGLSGTIAAPRLKAALQVNAVSAAGLEFAKGTALLRYQAGAILVDEVNLQEGTTQLTVTGSALPTKLSLEVSGDQADLAGIAAALLPRLGLDVQGKAQVQARVTGTWERPRVEARLAARAFTINGTPFDELAIAGSTADGAFQVEAASLRRGESLISASGNVGLRAGSSGKLDLVVSGEQVGLDLLTPFVSRFGLALEGKSSVQATITGSWAQPRVSFTLAAAAMDLRRLGANQAPLGRLPFEEVALAGWLSRGQLHLERAAFRQERSSVSVAGTVDLPASGSRNVDLAIGLSDIDLFTAIWRLDRFGVNLYERIHYRATPKLMGGRLGASVRVSGSWDDPRVEVADLVLTDLSLGDVVDLARGESLRRQLRRIEGDLTLLLHVDREHRAVALRTLEIAKLRAVHDPAVATLLPPAWVSPDGDMQLKVTIENLDLGLLAPWARYLTNLGQLELGGQGTINFDITGATRQPTVRGDVSVDAFRMGPLRFENASAFPITVESGVLSVEEINFSGGQFTPVAGMAPFDFTARLSLTGDQLLASRPPKEPGGPPLPGIQGRAGEGTFTVQGEVGLPSRAPERGGYGRLNLRAELRNVDLVVPDMIQGKLSGRLRLVNAWTPTGPPLLTTRTTSAVGLPQNGGRPGLAPDDEPLILSDAVLGLPSLGVSRAPFPFSPQLDVGVLIGDHVHFRYGSGRNDTDILVDPGKRGPPSTGYLRLRGLPTLEGIILDGEGESYQGTLAFPNGALTLRRGTAEISRSEIAVKAGQPPHVWVSAEADGRIGDYYISINPTGQIYPPVAAEGQLGGAPLSFNASSVPPLAQAYITALLAGQTLAPAVGGTRDIAELLSNPGATGITGGPITGLVLPGASLGLHELSFDVALHGPVRLRVGERLFRRVLLSYVSPLNGPPESRTFTMTYEVTSRWSVGWGVNELDRVRWEIQSFRRF